LNTQLLLSLQNKVSCRRLTAALSDRGSESLPPLLGESLFIRFLPSLTADRKRLYSNQPRGNAVHAGTLVRKRRIVLDTELRRKPRELARILLHEIFHFAWVRLNNQTRASYEECIRRELDGRARGELGWSAEWRKGALLEANRVFLGGPHWRDYLCESFCDTGAWLYSGIARHDEFTLAAKHRACRAKWFQEEFSGRGISI